MAVEGFREEGSQGRRIRTPLERRAQERDGGAVMRVEHVAEALPLQFGGARRRARHVALWNEQPNSRAGPHGDGERSRALSTRRVRSSSSAVASA